MSYPGPIQYHSQVDLIWQDSAYKIANIIIIIIDEAYVTISTAVCNEI